jgi:hypothetical protein
VHIACRQGDLIDSNGLDAAVEMNAAVLSLIPVILHLWQQLKCISLVSTDPEAQTSHILLWQPVTAFMAVLAPCHAVLRGRVMVNEVDVPAVREASGGTKQRFADMTVDPAKRSHLALFENSLSGTKKQQAEHTHQDTIKTRKYAVAACARRRGLPRTVLGQLGRMCQLDEPFFDWCHFEAVNIECGEQRGSTFAVLKHAGARCSLAGLITDDETVPVLREETRDTVRAFLLSVLDCCCYMRACLPDSTVERASPVRHHAVRTVGEPSGRKPSGGQAAGRPGGRSTGSAASGQSAGAPDKQSTTDGPVGSHSSVKQRAGVILHEPWGAVGSGQQMPVLIGSRMDAALAAGSLRAYRWTAPSGSHSVMYRVAGPPLRTPLPSWALTAAQPAAAAQLPVLKMVAHHKAAYFRRELRVLEQLQGLPCVVRPTALVRCCDFAGGFLLPYHPPYPVAACCKDGDTFVAFVAQVMEAVIALHRRGVAHGDLKPDVFRTDDEFAAWPGVRAVAPGAPLQLPRLRLMDFNMSLPAAQAPPYGRADHNDDSSSSSGSSDGRLRDRDRVPRVKWGTIPYCLVSGPQPAASALDCMALSSLLAHWLDFPAEVGGPDCEDSPIMFERIPAVRRLLKMWGAEVEAGTRPVWHLKILVLELLLLERGTDETLSQPQALETVWEVWRNVFWLETSAQKVLLFPDSVPWPHTCAQQPSSPGVPLQVRALRPPRASEVSVRVRTRAGRDTGAGASCHRAGAVRRRCGESLAAEPERCGGLMGRTSGKCVAGGASKRPRAGCSERAAAPSCHQ